MLINLFQEKKISLFHRTENLKGDLTYKVVTLHTMKTHYVH